MVVAVRAAFLAVAGAASVLLNPSPDASLASLTETWAHYDALHYLSIAREGYTGAGADPNDTAFFPLYPLLIRLLASLGLGPVRAALLISLAGTLVAAVYLYALAEEDAGEGAGRLAVAYLLFFPTAVFLCAPYTEATFLGGAVAAFYYARRGHWVGMALGAAVASGSRVTGAFLLVGLLVEVLRHRGLTKTSLARAGAGLAAGAVPLVAYAVYLHLIRGDALNFVTVQSVGWGRELGSPMTALLGTWQVVWDGRLNGVPVTTGPRLLWLGELAATALGTVFAIWAARRREWGYAAFMGCLMAVALTSGPLYLSVPRHLLGLFPIPLILAGVTRERPLAAGTLVGVLAPTATLGVLIYTRGTSWFF